MSVEPSQPPRPRSRTSSPRIGTFPPDPAFAAQANATADLYAEAEADFEAFWARLARERIDWVDAVRHDARVGPAVREVVHRRQAQHQPTTASTATSRNGLGDKVAYHWIGEPGDTRTLTFADLLREVSKAANALKELGIGTGDRVAIYMPMIPELPIAMLACARLGAPHTVDLRRVLSAEALSDRINDAEAKLVITADGGWRRGKPAALKPAVDEALADDADDRAHAGRPAARRRARGRHGDAGRPRRLVARHRRPPVRGLPGRSRSTREHMLYLLYTSGTTAKPKGIMHTTAGYLARARASPTRWSSTSSPTTSTGARPTSAG